MMVAEKAADLIAGNTPLQPRTCRTTATETAPRSIRPATAATADAHHEGGDAMTAALSVENLWKIFGPRADKIIGTPDADLSRAELKRRPTASSASRTSRSRSRPARCSS